MAPTATGGALGAAVSSARRVWTDRNVRRIQGREHRGSLPPTACCISHAFSYEDKADKCLAQH